MPISVGSMSTWTSFVGGMLYVSPFLKEPEVQSTNRHPTLSRTSAVEVRRLADVLPLEPPGPPLRTWSSGMEPLPLKVVTTGAPRCSARATSSAHASEPMAPPPATITGRFAPTSSSAARWDSTGSGRTLPSGSTGVAGRSAFTVSACASMAMSTWTGPGRPDTIAL